MSGDRFNANDALFVLAGANDVFVQLATVAAGGAPADAVGAMMHAGTELAALINTRIVTKGAHHVVVINLPDIVSTPFGQSQSIEARQLIANMTLVFNAQLQAGLASETKALLVDLYARSQLQNANPAQYGLTNVSTPACDLTNNALGSSLVCNGVNLIAGDVSHYAFSDTIHLTPYNYALLSQFVTMTMQARGWL